MISDESPMRTAPVSMKLWATLLVFALSISCAPIRRQPVAEDSRKYEEARKLFEQGLYRDALKTYRGIAGSEPHSLLAEKATFDAAYILVYFKNPDRDYAGARRDFEEFLLRYPASSLAGEAQSWIEILKALDQSKARALLEEMQSLARKSDDMARELLEAQREREALIKERDMLLVDKNNLVKKVDELLYERDDLLKEKETLLNDWERLTLDKADLEQKIQSLGREKEELVQAKEKLEKSLRDLTMIDVKVEKRKKKMKKEEKKGSKDLPTR